jgi:DNA polymerase-4
VLKSALGSWAESLRHLAQGIDDRPVVPNRPSKSCGAERTYDTDLLDRRIIRSEVERMAVQDAEWLERMHLSAKTVTLKVRYAGFETITRSETREPATRAGEEIAARAVALLERTEAGRRPIRLLGVSVHGFVSPEDRGDAAAEHPQLPLPL